MPLLGLAGAAAQAQQPADQGNAAQAPASLEEITVTGSRIRRTSDFDTPNPTTVVDDSYMRNLGIVNVGDAVQQLPVNVSNNTPTTTGNANFFTGSTIANLRGLNPFFGSRTLTLVDNRRFVPTNQGDGVDLNFIPSVLISRIDSVTGGASAAYGSGAISGVQNIFLNRTLEGGRIDIDGYQTNQSDALDRHIGAAYGHAFADDKAHLVVGYEAQNSDSVDCLERDWCQRSEAFIPGGVGMPTQVHEADVHANQISPSGVFNSLVPGAATALQVNEAGTGFGQPFRIGQGFPTAPAVPGGPPGNTATSPFNNVVGGDGIPIYQFTNLRAPVDRRIATGLFTYDFNDKLTMNVDVSYGRVKSTNITQALTDRFQFIEPDNAFLTPELAAGVGSFGAPIGLAGSFFNKDWTPQVDSHTTVDTKVKRGVVGFEGQFGESSWTWQGYYQYGKTDREQFVADNRHNAAYAMAVDSVIDPATGAPVCRVTQQILAMGGNPNDPNDPVLAAAVAAAATGPVNPTTGQPRRRAYFDADPRIAVGCVPLNPFGTQALTDSAHNYSFGALNEALDYKQQVAAWDTSGDIWKGMGAGPFQLAAGLELRRETGHNIDSENDPNTGQPVPLYTHADYLINYGETFAGKVDVSEAFVELNTPLLEGKPAAKRLEFNSAVRESRYENTGLEGTTGEKRTHDFTTWKISGLWDPLDWLRVRASRSRDMRAANFRELYYQQLLRAGGIFGYCGPAGTTQVDPCDWSLEGNVDLKPEKADTTTYGLVFTPQNKANGLQVAVDYFNIEINDAIQQANIRRVLDGCQISHLQEFCSLIVPDNPSDPFATFDPTGEGGRGTGVQSIRALAFNGSAYSYNGIDFSGNYTLDLANENSLNFRLLATHMLEQKFQPVPGQPFRDIVGQTGTANSFLADNQPTADWIANFTTSWNHGPINVTGQVRYVSDGTINYFGVTPDDPLFDLAGTTQCPTCALLVKQSDNRVPSYAVTTLSGSYTFQNVGPTMSMQVFATINNVFDRDPPFAAGGTTPTNPTNPVFFDTLGRAYRVGLRVNF